jgi:hypothetical protein
MALLLLLPTSRLCFFNGVPIGTSLHLRRVGLGEPRTESCIEESLEVFSKKLPGEVFTKFCNARMVC